MRNQIIFSEYFCILFNQNGAQLHCAQIVSVPEARHPCECSENYPALCLLPEELRAHFCKILIEIAFKVCMCPIAHSAVFRKVCGGFSHCNQIISRNRILRIQREGNLLVFYSKPFFSALKRAPA